MITVNLIPRARREAAQRKNHIRKWFVINALCLGVVVTGITLSRAYSALDEASLDAQLESLTGETETKNNAIRALEREIESIKAASDPGPALAQKPNWSILLALFAKCAGTDVVLQEVSLKQKAHSDLSNRTASDQATPTVGYSIDVVGIGKTHAAVLTFAVRLEKSNVFNKVSVTETRRNPVLAADAYEFELKCDLTSESEAMP